MKKLKFDTEKKRFYNFFKFGFFILLALHGLGLYINYDYWVFKMLISHHYVFTDALDTLYAEALGEENVRGYFRDFDRMVMAVVTERIREINQDRYTYLYTPAQFRETRERTRTVGRQVFYEAINDDIVYLYVPNISSHTRRYIQQNRSTFAQFPYLILDLRGNSGGLLMDFHQIADLFVERDSYIGYERTRWNIFTRQIQSRSEPYFDFNQVIILQNARTASAAEGLVLALKDNLPEVTTLGTTTFGKAVGQVTIPLTDGSAIRASVLLVEGPSGQFISGVGVAPDIFYDGEDMLEKALELIGG